LEVCILNASISNPFIPKLWTVLREDYGKAELRGDLAAGLTVAVVAARHPPAARPVPVGYRRSNPICPQATRRLIHLA
jgi:hypothetical protein